jgi:riboflavin-specific deaminase-like protein
MTADGKVATRLHSPTTYTSPADKRRLRLLRARADAVMVGAATVAADRMQMGVSDEGLRAARRSRGQPAEPLRVVLSNSGAIDPAWEVFRNRRSPLVLFAGRRPCCAAMLPPFCDLHVFSSGRVSLPCAVAILRADYGVRRLHCEGGPRLLRALLEHALLDDLFLTILPRIFGGQRAFTLTALPGPWLQTRHPFRLCRTKVVMGELHCTYARKKKLNAG